jgi:hypothetical protein
VRKASIALGCASALALFGAHAQDADATKHCGQLSDPVARLACYDTAFGVPNPPNASPPVVAESQSPAPPAATAPQNPPPPIASASQSAQQPAPVASQSIPQPPRAQSDGEAQFGDVGQLHRDLKSRDEAPKNITARVQAATALASGTYRISLDNGQIWRTTLADWSVAFNAGDTVTISRLPLGGYQISSEGTARRVGAVRIQ